MNSVESNIPVESKPMSENQLDHIVDDKSTNKPAEVTTVFSDPVNFTVKHPLHNAWTLWYDCPSKRKNLNNWSQNIKKLVTIDTVEDFWGVFNNIAKPTELSGGANYHFFREGIRPEWEDPANENGGKWVVLFKKKNDDIDSYWMHTLLACIGETLDEEDELNGAIYSPRAQGHRLTLWTRSHNDQEKALRLGHRFKEVFQPCTETFEFSSLTESSKSKANKIII